MQGDIYHVMTKSIAGFKIFNCDNDFLRVLNLLRFYQKERLPVSFYRFNEFLKGDKTFRKEIKLEAINDVVGIIAYCIMPTHLHLILQEKKEKIISRVMSDILNSYTKYFNIKNGRKGPLWEGRFKKILVESDEQLLHLTRYLHLNPVTAHLMEKPENWQWSSYSEYLGEVKVEDRICQFDHILDINEKEYDNFVKERVSLQRELAKIKSLTLE